MKLEQSFRVEAELERVWRALIDIERVAPCLPGAAVTGRNEDGSYNGTFKIKIGPTSAQYAGRLEMENVDDSLHSATMQANGTDRRGQGGAKARIVSRVEQAGSGATTVHVDTDYQITGRLARFGRGGMIEDIAERLLREFAGRLQEMLEAGEASAVATAADGPRSGEANGPPPPEPSEAAAEDTPAPEAPREPVPPPGAPTPIPGPEEIQGLSLLAGVLAERVRRQPVPLVAAGLILLLLLLGRRRR